MNSILVTGGAGYIGSHAVISLCSNGYAPVIVDNFSNSQPEAIRRVSEICGREIPYYDADINDKLAMANIFRCLREQGRPVSTVVHFAAYKAVGESVSEPVKYYANNVGGTIALLEIMNQEGVENIVFSSSATVYGEPLSLPLVESHRIAPTNPYGWSKAMAEQILRDWVGAASSRSAIALRYFNPIGAHRSGVIGECPNDIPNNLFPYITQVASGRLDNLGIFGNDYPTPDGTGVRDYLHVEDLADGHAKAVKCFGEKTLGFIAINLGTGEGVSVKQLITAFEQATGMAVPFVVKDRRAGDVAEVWADASLARELLGWATTRTILDMCNDGWRWQVSNPNGYERDRD